MRHSGIPIALAVALAGCGHASADPARFSGRFGTGSIDPAQVQDVKNKPPGYATLGHVKARCSADEGVRSMRNVALADVDCSEELLVAALREKAAIVGGRALVERECTRDDQSPGDAWKSTLISCSATVATSAGATAGSASWRPMGYTAVVRQGLRPIAPATDRDLGASGMASAALEYESPEQAFRVKVSFSPADAARQFAPRPADRVNELAVLPPSHIVMGDITARCQGECDRAAVRYAVRAAAGRVGATDVAEIACVRSKHGFLCTGRAARPEVDPETNALAR